MREIVIEKNEAGQRLDKFLAKYMNEASKSFFYKMICAPTCSFKRRTRVARLIVRSALNAAFSIFT